MKNEYSGQVIDLVGMAHQLADHFVVDPKGVDPDLVSSGESLLAIFNNLEFGGKLKGLLEVKEEAIEAAIDDIASGLPVLRQKVIGVYFSGSQPLPYQLAFGESPPGTTLFSISWKNQRAFQNWRSAAPIELTQDEVNASIYRLALCLAEIR